MCKGELQQPETHVLEVPVVVIAINSNSFYNSLAIL
jgi:hypothetical protein